MGTSSARRRDTQIYNAGALKSGSFTKGAMASGGLEDVFREDIAFPTF